MRIGLKDENVDIINYKLYNGRKVMLKMTNGELTDVTLEPLASDLKCKPKCTCDETSENYKEFQKISESLNRAKVIINKDYIEELKKRNATFEEKIDKLRSELEALKTDNKPIQSTLYGEVLKMTDKESENITEETNNSGECQQETNS